MRSYQFRPLRREDLPLVARWLRAPQVARWWGDPDQELATLTEDLEEPLMRQWIVECGRRPFAYVQAYRPPSWPQPHLANLPEGAQAIDVFIGEPDMFGRGHGAALLTEFARMLIKDGAACVVVDPHAENHRARGAYARAGFVGDELSETPSGPVAVMVFKARSL
jgi:aminoglycoside 6'-N-acetyltransferase